MAGNKVCPTLVKTSPGVWKDEDELVTVTKVTHECAPYPVPFNGQTPKIWRRDTTTYTFNVCTDTGVKMPIMSVSIKTKVLAAALPAGSTTIPALGAGTICPDGDPRVSEEDFNNIMNYAMSIAGGTNAWAGEYPVCEVCS